jgi:hypothetical protein
MNPSQLSPEFSNRRQQLQLLEELRRLDQRNHQHIDDIRRDHGMDLIRLLRADHSLSAEALMGGAQFPGSSLDESRATCANTNLDCLRSKVHEISRLHRPIGGALNGLMAPSLAHPLQGHVADPEVGVSKLAASLSPGFLPSIHGQFGSGGMETWGTTPNDDVAKFMGGLNPTARRLSIQDEMTMINYYRHQSKRPRTGPAPASIHRRRNSSSSSVVLPSLTGRAPRSTTAPMISFQRLWRSPRMASCPDEIRKELFVRRVARGRVPILDNSERLPRGRNLLLMDHEYRQSVVGNQQTKADY